MKTHEFKTEKGEFVVDELDATDIGMYKFFDNPKTFRNGIHLQPLFLLSECTEEKAKGVVDETVWNFENGSETHYRNYETESELDFTHIFLPTALESLHSLLTSKGIDINNGNWYLFKKV